MAKDGRDWWTWPLIVFMVLFFGAVAWAIWDVATAGPSK